MTFHLRAIVALAISCAVLSTAALPSTISQKIEAQRKKTQQIQAQLHQKRAQLHAATIHLNDLQTQLNETNSAIDRVRGVIGGLDDQQRSTQRKLWWNTIQLEAAQKTLRLHDSLLKRRLVDVYEHGELGYASVLLASKSFSDFVERWEDLRLIIQANERAVRARKAAEATVVTAQNQLESTQLALEQQTQEQQRAQNQLDTLAQERSNLVAVADAQRSHVATQVAQMEDLSAEEEARLEAFIRERQAEIEAAQAAARRAAGIVGPSTSPGVLSWPVSGTITSPFGMRQNPFGGGMEFHPGLDIAAPTGTTVTAAAGGTIISAGWYGGYGNYILIDNGGGMSTGYGHLSQIFVSNGQTVQKGQAIGAVGSTGESTGPHLHFEVRIAGKPTDPAPYLH